MNSRFYLYKFLQPVSACQTHFAAASAATHLCSRNHSCLAEQSTHRPRDTSSLFRNKVNLFGLESMQYRLGRLSKDCQGLKSSSANSRSLLPVKAQGEELRKAHRRCERTLGNVICRVSFLAGLSRNRVHRVTKRLTQACRRKTKGIKRAEQ